MRFCEQCGPLGWKEGHNVGCYILQKEHRPPTVTSEAFIDIDGVWSPKYQATFHLCGSSLKYLRSQRRLIHRVSNSHEGNLHGENAVTQTASLWR